MFSARTVVRSSRGFRTNAPGARHNVRQFAEAPKRRAEHSGSSQAGGQSSSNSNGGSSSSHYVGGAIAGASASLLVFGILYQVSGVGTAARSMKQAKNYMDRATEQMKIQFNEKTPDANEALETLKQTARKYAMFVPGGREFVDNTFKDIDIIREKHAEEVDDIVKNAYEELREVSNKGLSIEAASQSWSVLLKYLERLASLAVDAGQDILNNHPKLKNKLGDSFDQLKQFGDDLGPEAKKQVDETYKDIQGIVKQGLNSSTVDKIRQTVQEKIKALKELRDRTWRQGYEQIQPLLKDNPEVQKLVEDNIDTFENGNITEALGKIKEAVDSGDTGDLNKYIQKAKSKTNQISSNGISNWLQTIPGGSVILPQLQKLRDVAEAQAPEAEKLAKDTMEDIKQVLDKRSQQVEDLYKKAKNQGKD